MEGYPVNLLHFGTYVSSSNPLPVTGLSSSSSAPTSFQPTQLDAFGRLRVSQPLTLFDSSYRFQENNRFHYSSNNTASYSFNSNEACIALNVGASSNDRIYRESSRVFAYQPGKSLLIYESFAMSPLKDNLRQRIGYFDTSNGIYFQADGSNLSFVRRSAVSGAVLETTVSRSAWNYDRLDGTGPSQKTLDITRSQILFIDVEWLGVGTVRTGFIMDGEYRLCHRFHHANEPATPSINTALPYMTTACLPVRAELENTGATGSSSRFNVICTSVMSEGGYNLIGKPLSIGYTVLDAPYTISAKNTLYPVLAIRLKASRMGAIVIPVNVSLIPTASSDYRWALIFGATVSGGGAWVSAGTESSVEYKLDGTNALTDGIVLRQGYFSSGGNNTPMISLDSNIFKYQLERNSFTGVGTTLVLAVASKAQNTTVLASIDIEETT